MPAEAAGQVSVDDADRHRRRGPAVVDARRQATLQPTRLESGLAGFVVEARFRHGEGEGGAVDDERGCIDERRALRSGVGIAFGERDVVVTIAIHCTSDLGGRDLGGVDDDVVDDRIGREGQLVEMIDAEVAERMSRRRCRCQADDDHECSKHRADRPA